MSVEFDSAHGHDMKQQDDASEADDNQNAMLPLVRSERDLERLGWGETLEHLCGCFKSIQTAHGNESIAFICSDLMSTEEMALIGAFAKFGMGIMHGGSLGTDHGNAMGASLFGNTTHLLGGHDFVNPRHRRKVAMILNISEMRIPGRPSWPLARILEHVRAGTIRALWLIGPVLSDASNDCVGLEEVLALPDFLVLQDEHLPAAANDQVDVYLPTCRFSDKEGTVIDSEHRIRHIVPTTDSNRAALSDFELMHRIADVWGCNRWIERWTTPELVFQTMKKLSAGQPCDITGIRDYAHLDEYGGIPWPLPKGLTDS